jgi:hypothetical protein
MQNLVSLIDMTFLHSFFLGFFPIEGWNGLFLILIVIAFVHVLFDHVLAFEVFLDEGCKEDRLAQVLD